MSPIIDIGVLLFNPWMTRRQKENSSLKIFEHLKTFFFFSTPSDNSPLNELDVFSTSERMGMTKPSSYYEVILIPKNPNSAGGKQQIWGTPHMNMRMRSSPIRLGSSPMRLSSYPHDVFRERATFCPKVSVSYRNWAVIYKPEASYRFWKVRAKPWKPTWIPAK